MEGMVGYGFGFHGFGWIFWLLILGLIFFLVQSGNDSTEKSSPSALEILKERYAKDEISKDEYEEKRRQLS